MSYEDEKALPEGEEKDGVGFGFDLDEEEDAFDDDIVDDEIPEGFHEDFGAGGEEAMM